MRNRNPVMASELKNVITQGLECPVCLNIFNDPKILSCSHTYCKGCLERLMEYHENDQKLICPVCRAETQVPNQDISKLQTSLALKSLVDDVKNQHQCCTHCKSKEKPRAVVYCPECGKYLCITCQAKHTQWEDEHEVVAMSEITSGKVSVRRYRKCKKHPKEDEECFCCECRRFACFRCVVIEHKDEGHRVIEASVYESNHLKSIEDLKSKADKKLSCFQKYIDFIDEQKDRVSSARKQCIDDINKAYEESVRQLTESKTHLSGEVTGRTEEAEKELDEMKKSAQQHIAHLTAITGLVTSGTKIPLEMDALAAHDTLCQKLQEALKQDDPDYKQPGQSSKKGKCIVFERNHARDELSLGKIVNSVRKSIALPKKDSMNSMVPTPDGSMAVGCKLGGIEIFSADGQLQRTVLERVDIRGSGFLSDGRYVVLNHSNCVKLYTPECDELNVLFETVNRKKSGSANLAADSSDQIFVSYRKAQNIQVFSSAGGKAIRNIYCNGYEPWQITRHNDYLIIGCSNTLRMIDQEGNVKCALTKPSGQLHAAVSQVDSVLVAWVKCDEGLVSIDEYTSELNHVRNLIPDYKIEKPGRHWYCLQEFRSGEIAFCTPDRLYIFY